MANSRFALLIAVSLAVTMMSGCASQQQKPPAPAPQNQQAVLDAGFAALESKQYNDAINKADQILTVTPHGPKSAEAFYLKGRALEGQNAAGSQSAEQIVKNLKEARADYIQALDQVPPQPLESYIRTSLANVAYFQDDYTTAINQWQAAYDKLDRDDVKAWALYRTGVSQQRLGQFETADQTFAAVQQQFPDAIPAQRAKEHTGARAFYVQLATFASPQSADAAIADLKRQGINATRVAGPDGHSLLRLGPISSYQQAQYFKTRLAAKYPDAIILP